jgi:glycine cleavage system H protein
MIPDTLRYTKSHEWAKFEGDIVTVGVTKFAADQLTDITYIDLPHPGDHVFAGQECGTIETVKAVNSLYSPVDGEIIAVNERLSEEPSELNKDPYGAGWLFKVRVEKPGADQPLLDAKQYARQLESEGH